MSVAHNKLLLDSLRQRFCEQGHRERYHQRAAAIETVFAYLKRTLGFTGWLLRGTNAVAAEASLFKIAYQLKKVHVRQAAAQ